LVCRSRSRALTPREREVCLRVAQGLLNKQIAVELGAAEKTTVNTRLMELNHPLDGGALRALLIESHLAFLKETAKPDPSMNIMR
jgi:FixJ family two-component response regulator